jgi:hypothetical protein
MAGRPRMADAGTLYAFAHQFYWDFRRIAEGYFRWKRDEDTYRELAGEIDRENLQLNNYQKVALVQAVRREIEEGRLTKADKISRLRELGKENVHVTHEWLHGEAAEASRKQIKVPGRPEVIKALLQARTPADVRSICKDAFVSRKVEIAPGVEKELTIPDWPIPVGSVLPGYLSEYAAQIIAAKNDHRFPKSTTRPSSLWKQLWFLSRALAGALYGVSTRTTINLVGSMRPDESFEESNAAKPVRKRARFGGQPKGRTRKK